MEDLDKPKEKGKIHFTVEKKRKYTTAPILQTKTKLSVWKSITSAIHKV